MIMTTTPGVEGQRVTSYLGVLAAQSVLGVDAMKDFAAGFSNFFGGRSAAYEGEYARGVQDALAELEGQALARGADAVVGLTSTTKLSATGRC